MATRMLIDATHEEETRVVVVKGNRVEEFDFETAARRPLKGNIYLARVTRVEPSLQAAFVDFGGNRHGFLAFSEIHPDYYQIPVADRERLKQEEAEAAAADEDDEDEEEEEEETSGKEAAATGRGRRDAQGGESGSSDEQGGHAAAGHTAAGDEAAAGQDAAERSAEAADAPTGDHDDARAEPEGPAEPAPHGDLPSATQSSATQPAATLPERSGLRRVARLFGFGGDEEPQANAGAWQPAAAGDRYDDQDDDGEDDDSRDTGGAADHGQDAAAEARGEDRPQREETGSAGEAAGDEGLHEPQAHMLAELDDEDRPAEERDDQVEAFGGDAVDEVRRRSSKRRPLTRRYKIQEVIKRRQILLVQVVKEERGNKGAALTTYMSLAGRYCVLMPNSPNGGGISRKIVSATDRKRLKGITGELDVPEGMGMIVRTAGMERTRAEIKRDFEFLLRTWDNIRELTLASMAPCLVYEEANLIKRAIRDVYNKDVDEVLVEGENGYRHAKDFMKMLMPSHSKRVQPYKDRIPLFHRYQVENQLDEMFYPTVQLKSGGYIVINATEALVAIDVNSGRSTKEHNIEGTAYKTNMEAAEEVARQLRLRDMAGLIVIDFIDMDDSRNARNVERKLKECLKLDRARIQVGRISSFGLLEMSRQRLRPSLVEQSMVVCPHCDGQGHVRSVESAAIRAIRAAEDEGIRERSAEVTLIVPTTVAIYLLNSKRDVLQEIEGRYGIRVLVKNDDELGPSDFNLERSKTRSDGEPPVQKVITAESVPYRGEGDDEDEDETDSEPEAQAVAEEEADTAEAVDASDDDSQQKGDRRGGKRRRRRRRRSGEEAGEEARSAGDGAGEGEEEGGEQEPAMAASAEDAEADSHEDEDDGDGESAGQDASADDDEGQSGRRGRRRGRRGGRRRRRRQDREDGADQVAASGNDADGDGTAEDAASSDQAGRQQEGSDAASATSFAAEGADQDIPAPEDVPEEVAEDIAGQAAEGEPGADDQGAADRMQAGIRQDAETADAGDAGPLAAAEPSGTGGSRTGTGEPEAATAHAGEGEAGTAEVPEAEVTPAEVTPAGATEAGDAEARVAEPEAGAVPEASAAPVEDTDTARDTAPPPQAAAPEPGPAADEGVSTADDQAAAPAAEAEAEAEAPDAPPQEPATGAVLTPEEYAAAAGSEAGSGPRRGWWRRSARPGEGGSAGTGQD